MSDKITAANVLRSLRKFSASGDDELLPMWVVKHEKALWIGCTYFFLKPAPVPRLVIDELWRTCNLGLEPMRFTAGLAITREQSNELPELARLVPEKLGELIRVEPRPLSAGALMWQFSDEDGQEMWRRVDGAWTVVNAEYATLVRSLSDAATWYQGVDPYGVVVGISDDGDLAALLMPIRPGGDRQLIRDPDLPPALFEL